jgi:hypothetical protein
MLVTRGERTLFCYRRSDCTVLFVLVAKSLACVAQLYSSKLDINLPITVDIHYTSMFHHHVSDVNRACQVGVCQQTLFSLFSKCLWRKEIVFSEEKAQGLLSSFRAKKEMPFQKSHDETLASLLHA